MRKFVIQILTDKIDVDVISEILGQENSYQGEKSNGIWTCDFKHEPGAIDAIYNLFNSAYPELNNHEITKEDITLWYYVESDNKQINMEFSHEELELVAKLGLTLCISAWDKDGTISMDDLTG